MVASQRGQMILVGAIAIAIILIAMTTVLNSAVFTENVAQGNSVEVTGDVQEFDREAVRNVRSLVLRVNHRTQYANPGANGEKKLRENVRNNVSSYSRILAEAYADTGSVFVNVTYDETTLGQRVVQDEDEEFTTNNGGSSTWALTSAPLRLGWFVVNVDVQNVSQSDPVYIELTDTSGSELNVSMRQTSDGKLAVRSEIDGGSVSDVTCDPTNGRVLVDVVDGSTHTGDCEFNSTEHLQPTLTDLRFVGGDNARGKYDIVLNLTDPNDIQGTQPCVSGKEPCRTLAAWSANFTTYYQTGDVGYERTHSVEVYDG